MSVCNRTRLYVNHDYIHLYQNQYLLFTATYTAIPAIMPIPPAISIYLTAALPSLMGFAVIIYFPGVLKDEVR